MAFDGGKVTKWKQGDCEFAIRQYNPFLAMRILGDLQKLIVPALGGAANGLSENGEQADMIAALGGALKNIAQLVDGTTLEKAMTMLLDSEYVAVKQCGAKSFTPADMDTLAAIYWGRPFDMVALCLKVFQVNYLDFTTSCNVPIGIREAVNAILSMVQDESESISEV
jgi:hypothetical protein